MQDYVILPTINKAIETNKKCPGNTQFMNYIKILSPGQKLFFFCSSEN